MKSHHATLVCSLILAATLPGRVKAADPLPSAPRDLTIVVVDSLGRGPGRITDYDWINSVFTQTLQARKWPVKITVERFAANTPAHDTELRIFYQGIREDTPGDRTFRAWMVLYVHGEKHDFGIVRFTTYPRPLEQEDAVMEHVVRGAALAAADLIEPILFPKEGRQKP